MSESSPSKNDNDGACDVKDDCEEDESGSSSSSSFVVVRGDDPELFETVRALVDDTDAAGRMREGEDDPSDAGEEDDGDDDAAEGIGRVQLSNNSGANAGGGGGPEAGEEPRSEEMAGFLAFTSTSDAAVARQYLEMSGHDLGTAVGLFVDHGGIATATGPAAADEEPCAASAATTPREDEGDDEGKRGGGAGCKKLLGAVAAGAAAGRSPPRRTAGQWNRRHDMEAEIGGGGRRRPAAATGALPSDLVLVGKILSTPTPTLRVSTSSAVDTLDLTAADLRFMKLNAPLHFMKVNVETWVIDLYRLPGWWIELPGVEDVEDVSNVGRRKVMVKAEPWGWPYGEPPATSTIGKTNDRQDCHRHRMEGFEIQLNAGDRSLVSGTPPAWFSKIWNNLNLRESLTNESAETLRNESAEALRNEFKNAKIYVTREVLMGQRNWLV